MINRITNIISKFSRIKKQIILIFCDFFILLLSIYISFLFKYNSFFIFKNISINNFSIFFFPLISVLMLYRKGLYSTVLKHIDKKTVVNIFYSIFYSSLILFLFNTFYFLSIFTYEGLLGIVLLSSIV